MTLALDEHHEVWLKLMIPHQRLTQTTELRITRNDVVWEALSDNFDRDEIASINLYKET